ncbi:MAG: MAPEG family protein [Sphingomonadales bacterium]|nr:MAPEG family protein [Sphingomonadales bacterium]MBD3775344.1 MAPEG family protein [Paracoccaceae bacterium]MBD3814567.1 MAPEG family protein [Betaproteobacteria bacterium]
MLAKMLAPAAVLVVWSLVMLTWMAATRLPALAKSGAMKDAKPGGRGQDLDGVLPDTLQWKAHNYNHLMEQPTIFYATVVIIALMGAAAADIWAAWIYVALRIVHSLYQATVNIVPTRLMIFSASSLALLYLAVRAVMLTLFANPGIVA